MKSSFDDILYADGIENLLSGELGNPRSIRISVSVADEIAAEARITGVSASDVMRKRIASSIIDYIGMPTKSRIMGALFLRQAIRRAVSMSDADLASHIELLTSLKTMRGVSDDEQRVFEVEAQIRQSEAVGHVESHIN